jgi:xanthine dehydrogenase accessory factor
VACVAGVAAPPGAGRVRASCRIDTSLELLVAGAADRDDGDVLATVVSTAGSTYRKPGARMLIRSSGGHVGLLSGGCLEQDLAHHAGRVRSSREPMLVTYDQRRENDALFGIGSGCGGLMRILLEPACPGSSAAAALTHFAEASQGGLATAAATVWMGPVRTLGTFALGGTREPPSWLQPALESALAEHRCGSVGIDESGSRLQVLLQCLAPPPRLLVCGAGPDSPPIVALAVGLGWRVTVLDHRAAYAVPSRFPGAQVLLGRPEAMGELVDSGGFHAALVMSHHFEADAAYLSILSGFRLDYLGLLGPDQRRERLLQRLGEEGASLASRLTGPVGIRIGAAFPEAIAVSVVAQIHEVLASIVAQPE